MAPTVAQRLDRVLDRQRDLYSCTSEREKRLLRIMKKLAQAVAFAKGLTYDETFWLSFQDYIRQNQAEVSEKASEVITEYLEKNGPQKSAGHVIQSEYIAAFKTWGVPLEQSTLERIDLFKRQIWNPAKAARSSVTKKSKEDQYELVMPKWNSIIQYLRTVEPDDFRLRVRQIVESQASYRDLPNQTFINMGIIVNKCNRELKTILRSTVAYISLLFTTGMRSITGLDLSLSSFQQQPDGSILLTRVEHKVGNF